MTTCRIQSENNALEQRIAELEQANRDSISKIKEILSERKNEIDIDYTVTLLDNA